MVKDAKKAPAPNSLHTENAALRKEIATLQGELASALSSREQIAQTNENLEKIIALMPGNIYWKHVDGRYQYCNDQVAYMLGLSHRDEIKGKTIYDIMAPQYAAPAEANDDEAIEAGEPISFEEIGFDARTNERRIFLTTKAPLYDNDNQIIGIFGLAVDITERKKIEEELETAKAQAEIASLAKSEFIANMSHDLRTPFSGILGFAHLLHKNEIDDTKKEELGYIIASSEKLLNLLNEILQNTKDGTQHVFEASEFDVLEVMHETRTLFTAEIERKQLACTINSRYQCIKIASDKHRLHRVFINLLSNAIKFTDEGGVTIDVELDDAQSELTVRITDTGIGIPEDAFKSIFERFTRLTSSYEGKYIGTGVGLWLVKKFIEDLGGEITVASEAGAGSCFTCTLAVKVVSAELETASQTLTSQRSSEPAALGIKSRSLLMVEDDEITAHIQLKNLEHAPYQIHVARTGQSALEMCQQQQFDLILVDIGLPDMSGFELAKKIKALSPSYSKTPIVGLTAHITQHEQAELQDSAINKLMLKPLTQSLCATMADWF